MKVAIVLLVVCVAVAQAFPGYLPTQHHGPKCKFGHDMQVGAPMFGGVQYSPPIFGGIVRAQPSFGGVSGGISRGVSGGFGRGFGDEDDGRFPAGLGRGSWNINGNNGGGNNGWNN